MIPTDTDLFLASVRSEASKGLDVAPEDALRLLALVEELGREVLRLRTECRPHCALFKGLPLPPGVLSEVLAERERQDAKWGQQDHPWHVPGLSVESVRHELRIPSSTEARDYVRSLTDYGLLSWSAILLEEVCEAVDCDDEAIARRELVQVAAVAVAAVEAIDRRLPPSSPTPPTGAPAPSLSSAAVGSEGGSAWLESKLAREVELGELPPGGASGGAARSPVCPDCRGSGVRRSHYRSVCLTCAGEGLLGGGQ